MKGREVFVQQRAALRVTEQCGGLGRGYMHFQGLQTCLLRSRLEVLFITLVFHRHTTYLNSKLGLAFASSDATNSASLRNWTIGFLSPVDRLACENVVEMCRRRYMFRKAARFLLWCLT
jgi:hypothetical protein